mgnify:CR=1 FL=1
MEQWVHTLVKDHVVKQCCKMFTQDLFGVQERQQNVLRFEKNWLNEFDKTDPLWKHRAEVVMVRFTQNGLKNLNSRNQLFKWSDRSLKWKWIMRNVATFIFPTGFFIYLQGVSLLQERLFLLSKNQSKLSQSWMMTGNPIGSSRCCQFYRLCQNSSQ